MPHGRHAARTSARHWSSPPPHTSGNLQGGHMMWRGQLLRVTTGGTPLAIHVMRVQAGEGPPKLSSPSIASKARCVTACCPFNSEATALVLLSPPLHAARMVPLVGSCQRGHNYPGPYHSLDGCLTCWSSGKDLKLRQVPPNFL